MTLPLAVLVTGALWMRQRFDELVPMTPRMAMLTVAYAMSGNRVGGVTVLQQHR